VPPAKVSHLSEGNFIVMNLSVGLLLNNDPSAPLFLNAMLLAPKRVIVLAFVLC